MSVDRRVPGEVTLLDGGTLGMGLLPHLSGVDRLLVIDAVDAGERPGTVMRFEGNALRGLPGKASVHQLGFADLMVAMQLLGERPNELVLLGIQPESTEWGAELTESLSAELPHLIELAIGQLELWSRCAEAIPA